MRVLPDTKTHEPTSLAVAVLYMVIQAKTYTIMLYVLSLTADVVGVMCDMVGTFDVVGCYDLVSLALSIFESCLVMCINIS